MGSILYAGLNGPVQLENHNLSWWGHPADISIYAPGQAMAVIVTVYACHFYYANPSPWNATFHVECVRLFLPLCLCLCVGQCFAPLKRKVYQFNPSMNLVAANNLLRFPTSFSIQKRASESKMDLHWTKIVAKRINALMRLKRKVYQFINSSMSFVRAKASTISDLLIHKWSSASK